jgi:hypothetical protein
MLDTFNSKYKSKHFAPQLPKNQKKASMALKEKLPEKSLRFHRETELQREQIRESLERKNLLSSLRNNLKRKREINFLVAETN